MIQPIFALQPYSNLSKALQKECNRVWRAAFGYSWFSSLALYDESDWVCVCIDESSQNVLACCFISFQHNSYYIYNVCSDPKYKGYGFGRSLLKHVLSKTKFLKSQDPLAPASLKSQGEQRELRSPGRSKSQVFRLSVHLANVNKATVPFVEQRVKLYSDLGFGIETVKVENNMIIVEMSTDVDPFQNFAWFQHISEKLNLI